MNRPRIIKPLDDRIVIEPMEEKTVTDSGVHIPETAEKDRPQRGIVLAVGPGRRDGSGSDGGALVPVGVHPGDTVLFALYGPYPFKLDGKDVLIAAREDILAVFDHSGSGQEESDEIER